MPWARWWGAGPLMHLQNPSRIPWNCKLILDDFWSGVTKDFFECTASRQYLIKAAQIEGRFGFRFVQYDHDGPAVILPEIDICRSFRCEVNQSAIVHGT